MKEVKKEKGAIAGECRHVRGKRKKEAPGVRADAQPVRLVE